jgi:hypothetical protein
VSSRHLAVGEKSLVSESAMIVIAPRVNEVDFLLFKIGGKYFPPSGVIRVLFPSSAKPNLTIKFREVIFDNHIG